MAGEEREINLGPAARGSCPVDSCQKPDDAAEKAVKRVFSIFGVDVDVPKDVEKFRAGLRFGESMHKLANRGLMTVVVVFSAAIAASLMAGVLYKVKCFITGEG